MAALTESNLRNSIAAILKGADLKSLSSKKVRKQLEDEYDTDLTDRKEEIDDIIMEMVTGSHNENDKKSGNEESENSSASDNDQSESGSEDGEEESDDNSDKSSESEDSDKAPPKKKQKTTKKSSKKSYEKSTNSSQSDSEVDDEALARKLQEEEIKSRSRAVKKSSGTKRESKGGGGGGGSKQKKENSYTRKCLLSPALASVVGSDKMARHDVVKKMWSLVKERNLFDPSNRQFAICDEQLHKVIGTKRFRMFGMMKYLKNHMTDLKQ